MAPLRQRMIDAMVLRGFAARIQETCLSASGRWLCRRFLGGRCLSMGDYVMEIGATRGATAAGAC
jgi:hypothetical protein